MPTPDSIYGALAPDIGAGAGALPSDALVNAMARIAAARRAQMGVAPAAGVPSPAPVGPQSSLAQQFMPDPENVRAGSWPIGQPGPGGIPGMKPLWRQMAEETANRQLWQNMPMWQNPDIINPAAMEAFIASAPMSRNVQNVAEYGTRWPYPSRTSDLPAPTSQGLTEEETRWLETLPPMSTPLSRELGVDYIGQPSSQASQVPLPRQRPR